MIYSLEYIPELLIFIVLLFVDLLHVDFNLIKIRLWSDLQYVAKFEVRFFLVGNALMFI